MKKIPIVSLIVLDASLAFLLGFFLFLFFWSSEMVMVAVSTAALYLPLIYVSRRIHSKSALHFVALMVASRIITLPMMHYAQDSFTESGWTAIKEFDFSPIAYSKLVLMDGLALILITIAFLIVRATIPKKSYTHPIKRLVLKTPKLLPTGLNGNKAILLTCVLVFINYYIFTFAYDNKIGITGIEPNPLPLKLSGLLYYYEKFIGPIILFYVTKNSKSRALVLILSLLLIFVGATTLSRSTIAMWAIPVVYVAYRKCKSWALTGFVAIMVIAASMLASVGRTLMFVADGTDVGIDLSVGAIDILLFAASNFELSDFFITGASLIARLGGGQEMVLGAQTEFPDIGYALSLMLQIFTDMNFGVDYHSLVMLTHGFIPLEGTVAGIAYSGYMLAYLKSSFLLFALFATFSAVILNINDYIGNAIFRISLNRTLSNTSCFALNFVFFAMFMVSWYWFSVLLICVFVFVARRLLARRPASSMPLTTSSMNR